jgi:ABC-2 type transport system permease protein
MLVLAVLLGVVAAISQCLSALLARTMTSAVLSYAAVFALTVGTLITFALALPITAETVKHTYLETTEWDESGRAVPGRERPVTYESERTREDKVWWLLGPNPFVILADAAPVAPQRFDRQGYPIDDALDPLAEIRNAVRDARTPPEDDEDVRPGADWRSSGDGFSVSRRVVDAPGPVWPYGLAFNAALGLGAVAITIRRLRTPAHKLPRGIRVA